LGRFEFAANWGFARLQNVAVRYEVNERLVWQSDGFSQLKLAIFGDPR